MQILDSADNYLSRAPIPISVLEDGLHLRITNALQESDQFMLLCVLNGELLSFSVDGQKPATMYPFEIGAREEVQLDLMIKPNHLLPGEENRLHITLIGCLDDLGNIGEQSITVSIPLDSSNTDLLLPTSTIVYEEKDHMIPDCMEDEYQWIWFAQNGVNKRIPPSYTLTETHLFDIDVYFAVREGPIAMLLLLDNQTLPIDGKELICLEPDTNLYTYDLTLQLTPGIHQLYAIYFPLDDARAVFNTSEKLIITVPE